MDVYKISKSSDSTDLIDLDYVDTKETSWTKGDKNNTTIRRSRAVNKVNKKVKDGKGPSPRVPQGSARSLTAIEANKNRCAAMDKTLGTSSLWLCSRATTTKNT